MYGPLYRHIPVPSSQNHVTKQDVTQFFPSGVNFPGQREMAPGIAGLFEVCESREKMFLEPRRIQSRRK